MDEISGDCFRDLQQQWQSIMADTAASGACMVLCAQPTISTGLVGNIS